MQHAKYLYHRIWLEKYGGMGGYRVMAIAKQRFDTNLPVSHHIQNK